MQYLRNAASTAYHRLVPSRAQDAIAWIVQSDRTEQVAPRDTLDTTAARTNDAKAPAKIDFQAGTGPVDAVQLASLVGKHGGSMSTIFVDPGYRFFTQPGTEGFIGYRPTEKHAIVPQGPLSNAEGKLELLAKFREFCRANGKQMIIYAADQGVADWARAQGGSYIAFGAEHVFDVQAYVPADEAGASATSSVRKAVRKALADGVTAEVYDLAGPRDPAQEQAMEQITEEWKQSKAGGAFAEFVPLFDLPEVTQFMVARHDDQVVGLIKFHRVEDGAACLVEQMLQKPGAHSGTSVLMVDRLLKHLQATPGAKPCTGLSFGFEPTPSLGDMHGFNPITEAFVRGTYAAINAATGIGRGGKKAYREKFNVMQLPPSYIIFDPPHVGADTVKALCKNFNIQH